MRGGGEAQSHLWNNSLIKVLTNTTNVPMSEKKKHIFIPRSITTCLGGGGGGGRCTIAFMELFIYF